MPRGVDRLDEARLQGRLWDLTHLGAGLKSYSNWNRISSLSFSGSNVSQARDLSGNGCHFGPRSTDAGPTLTTLNGSRQNAVFSSSQSMAQSTLSITTASTTHSIAYLAKMGATKKRILASNDQNWLFGWWNGNMREWYDSTDFRSTGVADDAAWHLMLYTSNAGTPVMRDNGTAVTTSGSVAAGPGAFVLNFDPHGGDGYSTSEVFAVASGTVAWTTLEIQRIEGALMWEAGLVSSLPASHPFRNRPPLIGA